MEATVLERHIHHKRLFLVHCQPKTPLFAFAQLFKGVDLTAYPEAYRYMAARLAAIGRPLAPVVYRDGSPHTAQVHARYEAWLAGK